MKFLKNIFSNFTKKEIFMSNSAERYSRVAHILKNNNINFKTKSINSGTQNRQTGRVVGQIGENINLQIIYYIYVAKEDELEARNLIRNI